MDSQAMPDSNNNKPGAENEAIYVTANVQFTFNRLEAQITLKVDHSGMLLSLKYLKDVLGRYGINTGIDNAVLETLAVTPIFDRPITIARGTNCINGEDSELKFLFQLSRDLTPKIKEDGSVDFKNLGAIQTVGKGDVLVVKKPKTDGTPGMNVCGQAIAPKPGRDIPIPAGRNVVLSADKLKLFAELSGQAVYHNDRVSVLNTYVVEGDVSVATGNISFNGNVSVKGGVQSGFKIKASGDVEVNGVVEVAEIVAGGNIIIMNGFNGGEKGLLQANGSITTKFIQGGTVMLGGKLETTYIYNSNVRSKDTINVIGKGVVLGGQISAKKRVDAGTIGNETMTKTIVEVGNDPELIKQNQELLAEIENCNKNIKALDSAVSVLAQLKEAGKLPPEREEQLDKSQKMLEQLNMAKETLLEKKSVIDEQLANYGKGYVGVRNIAYPGVVIVMGSEQMPLKGKYSRTLFSRPEGYIKSGPL